MRSDLEAAPEWVQSMAERGMDMQTSPIDLASAAMPLLRGMRLLKAVKAGQRSAIGGLAVDSLKEGGQEALTSYLEDARNSAATVAEAGAMGVVGNVGVQAPFAIAGKVMQQPAVPEGPSSQAAPSNPADTLLDAVGDRQALKGEGKQGFVPAEPGLASGSEAVSPSGVSAAQTADGQTVDSRPEGVQPAVSGLASGSEAISPSGVSAEQTADGQTADSRQQTAD